MSGWAGGVPGMGETTVSYAGPVELRDQVPARTPEAAAERVEAVVRRASEKVERAVSAVGALRPPYPAALDGRATWLLGALAELRIRAAGTDDAFKRLADVSWLAADVEASADSLAAAAVGIGRGGGVPGSGRQGRVR